jgi:Ca2+/Na+ antiporter
MDGTVLLYSILIVFCAFLVYSAFKKQRQYKKEEIKTIFSLNFDDRVMRITCVFMLVFLVLVSSVAIYNSLYVLNMPKLDAFYLVILPIMFIILYIPLTQKTKITTLGIVKRNNLIRWGSIKGVDFTKPDNRGKQKAIIIYKAAYKDGKIVLNFLQNDEQFEMLKNTAKEYRSNKKNKNKDKRIEK